MEIILDEYNLACLPLKFDRINAFCHYIYIYIQKKCTK